MGTYIVKRAFQLLLLGWLVSTLSFSLLYMTGDPTVAVMGEGTSLEEINALRHQLGFDRPLLVQYVDFIRRVLVEGSFGTSIRHHVDALGLVLEKLPATFELALSATLFAVIFGLPIGLLTVWQHRRWVDVGLTALTTMSLAIPQFWLGIILMLAFGFYLKWLPLSGRGTWSQLVLPTLAVGVVSMAFLARLTKTLLLEQLSQDYVRTAQAKGQTAAKVLTLHAFRNAALPIVTLIGLNLGFLLGGAAIIEYVFGWPGIGQFVIQAVLNRDFPVVQAAVFVMALFYGVLNFVTDMAYVLIDPRIRYS